MKRLVLTALLFIPLSTPSSAADALQRLARDFGRSMVSLSKPRVGVLSFPYHDGKISSGSSILSERLTTYMADVKTVRVIERTLLKKVLEEQHLGETGVLDASAAKRVGKILDVDVLIVGTLNDLEGDQTELNARVLRADSGEVLAARRVVIDRVWTDNPHRIRTAALTDSNNSDEEARPVSNEAIEIGFPGGRSGGRALTGGR